MMPTADEFYQAALALPEEARAELAARLLDSLAPGGPSQLHPAWREELRRRLAQVDAGEVTPVPWSDVKQAAWDAIDRDAPDRPPAPSGYPPSAVRAAGPNATHSNGSRSDTPPSPRPPA